MLFKGRLRLPNDPGEGIPIDLVLEDVFLSLESEGEDFGEWRLDTVEINRLFSNQFSMQLDGEEMVFIADDALGFAYDGLSAVEDVKSRLSKRRIFKGRKPKKKAVAGRSEPEPEEFEPVERTTPEASPDVPMPEVVPFFPESNPSFADSVAESAVVDDGIAPVAPRPIEIADAEPEPVASPPPTPEPVVQSPPAAAPEPSPEADRPAASVETAAEPTPATPSEPVEAFDDDDEEDELVIEDVSAYGYVPVASASIDQRPVVPEPEPSDDEMEIEEAAPATGAVLREVHPLGEPEPAATAEIHPLGDPAEPEQPAMVDPETVADASPSMPEPEVGPEAEVDEPTRESAAVPLPPDGDSSFFAQWSSNGRAETDPHLEPESEATALAEETQSGPQTQKSGRHARNSGKSRSALFGRKKSREPEAHEHTYESSKTVGGITRKVCAICGHVSFAGEDVYQDW